MNFFADDIIVTQIKDWLITNLKHSYTLKTTKYNIVTLIDIDFTDEAYRAYFIFRFPNCSHYNGNLYLGYCTGLTTLPEGLSVGDYLNLGNCTGLTTLPEGLAISGNLDLWNCTGLTALPRELSVNGNLDLGDCTGLTALPESLSVGRDLNLWGCTDLSHIKSHPGVKGEIYR